MSETTVFEDIDKGELNKKTTPPIKGMSLPRKKSSKNIPQIKKVYKKQEKKKAKIRINIKAVKLKKLSSIIPVGSQPKLIQKTSLMPSKFFKQKVEKPKKMTFLGKA